MYRSVRSWQTKGLPGARAPVDVAGSLLVSWVYNAGEGIIIIYFRATLQATRSRIQARVGRMQSRCPHFISCQYYSFKDLDNLMLQFCITKNVAVPNLSNRCYICFVYLFHDDLAMKGVFLCIWIFLTKFTS